MPEAEWNDERTKIICELFVEQVHSGNRPNTHLNNIGYCTVASKFQQRTQLLYTKIQLKNKWDKFKSDYVTWKKLLIAGARANLHWDSARGTFAADDDWWKKINKELPGARRYRNAGIPHEDMMKIMFDYIDNNGVDPSLSATYDPRNGVDHSPLAADGLPSSPDSPVNVLPLSVHVPSTPNSPVNGMPLPVYGVPSTSDSPMHGMDDSPQTTGDLPPAPDNTMNGMNLHRPDNNSEHNGARRPVHESVVPSNRNKRPAYLNVTKKNKKTNTEMAMLMQSHLDRILELAQKSQATFEKFLTRAEPPISSIQDVMTLVRECGAGCGSNEHFIATELFVDKDQREMFLTMETPEERFQWLRRKYTAKYLSSPSMGLRFCQEICEIICKMSLERTSFWRRPEARFLGESGGQYLRDSEISQQELEEAQRAVGEFGGDNRAGIEGTLHRISAIRSRKGMIVGLTCRVGRAVTGHVDMVRDLLNYKESILFLGRPGVGKTTVMREIARVLADEFQKRVVIVDTSNEIGGDGDIPHAAIGGARRMQVPEPSMQHRVMIEAVENHMPEVVIVDEIGTEAEAQACRSIAERGVMLIGTAHGERLANIIKNPTLSDLIGGVETVTLGDDEARARRSQKSILERKAPPTFPFLIEMRKRHYWVTHRTERSVDMLLHGKKPLVEVRKRDNAFQVVIERWATYDGDGL